VSLLIESDHGEMVIVMMCRSTLVWERVAAGLLPPPRVTYDDWIICQEYFNQDPKYAVKRNRICSDGSYSQVQWSPRRHHASVVFKGYIYVLGGRAREFVEYSETRSVGGIRGPRVLDPASRTFYTSQRSVLSSFISYLA
jgi:hypothetical protein